MWDIRQALKTHDSGPEKNDIGLKNISGGGRVICLLVFQLFSGIVKAINFIFI